MDLLRAGFEALSDDRRALVVFADGSFGFVDDDDFRPRFGDPDHLFDCPGLVGEEVNTSDVIDAIEGFCLEGQTFGFGLEQVRLAAPLEQVALAFAEHPPGDVDSVEVDIHRQETEVGSGADGDLKHPGARLQFQFIDEFETVIGFAGNPVIKALDKVVTRSDSVIEGLVLEVEAADRADEQRNSVANGIDSAGRSIAQVIAGHLQVIARIRVAK